MVSANNLVELEPDLYQIRIPIPIRSLDYVYSYLAVDGDDNLLIDTGWPSEEAKEALQSSLKSLGLSFSKIKKIVVSHLHPDHFGLADLIQRDAPDAKVFMHKADAAGILHNQQEFDAFIDELHAWLGTHGTPPTMLADMLRASRETLRFFELPRPNMLVEGGETIKVGEKWNFQIIATPGHTIGMICLYDKKSRTLFSGDHILPTITPNVSLGPRYKGNPLGDYLDSLKKLSNIQAGKVLPSHENIFTNLGERIAQIELHHEQRLNEAVLVLENSGSDGRGQSAFEIASKLHWNTAEWKDLTPWDKRAALMETLAHLQYLKLEGIILEKKSDSGQIEFDIANRKSRELGASVRTAGRN